MRGLTKIENWTVEMIYIHKSRLIIGAVLGFVMGVSFMGVVYLLKYPY